MRCFLCHHRADDPEILQEMLPSVRRLAAIAFAPDPFSKPFLEQVRLAAAPRGTTVEPIMIQGPDEFEAAFDAMQKDG